MFITLEGGEGTGKTTQARLLVERLREAGYAVRLTREPGGTPLANGIRALLLHPEESLLALTRAGLVAREEGDPLAGEDVLPVTELLLLSAARAQHTRRIRAWLAAGEVVVCDRYADATRVYQGVARGLDRSEIDAAERLATQGLRPDLTLLFDLPVEEGLRRRAQEGDLNRLDREDVAFHQRVREGYLALAREEPERWVTLDASLPPEELAERVWQVVRERLGSPASGTREDAAPRGE